MDLTALGVPAGGSVRKVRVRGVSGHAELMGVGSLHARPRLNVVATSPQAAEGTSIAAAKGQFTFYRDGDASLDINVPYSVEADPSHATPASDYTALTGVVSMLAGERSVSIDVAALADGVVESTEAVRISLNIPPQTDPKYALGTSTSATVNILDRKKYFVYFYGYMGPGKYGDEWLDKLGDDMESRGYVTLGTDQRGRGGFRHSDVQGIRSLLDRLNADGNRAISAAEAESSDIRIAGWSFGGTQAANLAYDLRRVGAWLGRYRLDGAVAVQRLVTLDPVKVFPLKAIRGSVGDNVRTFVNLYQQGLKVSNFKRLDAQDKIVEHYNQRYIGDMFIRGDTIATTLGSPRAIQIQVDTQQGDQPQYRDRARDAYEPTRDNAGDKDPLFNGLPDEPRWRLFGSRVNHNTLPWHAYERAKNELL